jgi:hypothetical protein
VEDDFDARRIAAAALRAEGWTTEEAENGMIALECIDRVRPSIILLDLMMPEMDGFEFVARLRADPAHRNIPIVVLTAKELSPDERARLNGQVAKIIQKGSLQLEEVMVELSQLIAQQIRPVPSPRWLH